MHLAAGKHAQDQHVERALEEIDLAHKLLSFDTQRKQLPFACQGESGGVGRALKWLQSVVSDSQPNRLRTPRFHQPLRVETQPPLSPLTFHELSFQPTSWYPQTRTKRLKNAPTLWGRWNDSA